MIKFTRDTLPKEGDDYKAGETLEASPASELHWTKRNAAIEWVEPAKPAEKQKPKQIPKKRAGKYKG